MMIGGMTPTHLPVAIPTLPDAISSSGLLRARLRRRFRVVDQAREAQETRRKHSLIVSVSVFWPGWPSHRVHNLFNLMEPSAETDESIGIFRARGWSKKGIFRLRDEVGSTAPRAVSR
jgi:hypothetical protein